MWPKVLMQLFELLPHATRLVPIADRFFSQRAATEAALTGIAEGVHGEIGQVTKSQEGLYRQLQEQSGRIADMSEELSRTRTTIEQHGHRLEALDEKLASLSLWVKGG